MRNVAGSYLEYANSSWCQRAEARFGTTYTRTNGESLRQEARSGGEPPGGKRVEHLLPQLLEASLSDKEPPSRETHPL